MMLEAFIFNFHYRRIISIVQVLRHTDSRGSEKKHTTKKVSFEFMVKTTLFGDRHFRPLGRFPEIQDVNHQANAEKEYENAHEL